MAFNSRNIKTCTQGPPTVTPEVCEEKLCEDDTSTLSNDDLETSPKIPTMDKKTCLWESYHIDRHNISTVLESWEIISVRPTRELTSQKRMLGMNMVSTYKVTTDGYTGVRAIPSLSQAELGHMIATAQRDWAAPTLGIKRFFKKQETYGQNLAKRILELPASLPSKLGALLDCRFVATNKNPCVRREWKIVMLTPIAGALTDEGVAANSGKLRNKCGREQSEPVQKWLVIIRGQETRFNEKGFAAFGTNSNPWAKIDERDAAERYQRCGH